MFFPKVFTIATYFLKRLFLLMQPQGKNTYAVFVLTPRMRIIFIARGNQETFCLRKIAISTHAASGKDRYTVHLF